jgi:hypothetical protein
MTNPKFAKTGRAGRTYTVPDNTGHTVELPSVTTILNIVNKPAIAGWAARSVAEYAVRNHALISTMLERGDQENAVKLLRGSPWTARDKAADIGSQVHALIEQCVLGQPVTPTAAEQVYFQGFLDFLTDFPSLRFESAEVTVYNLTYGYAGTCDAVVSYGGKRGIHDWKTRQDKPAVSLEVYETERLQLAAYAHAERYLLDDGTSGEFGQVDGAALVLLGVDGYRLGPVDLEHDWPAFLHAKRLYDWKQTVDDTGSKP